jgi:uncharacterized membrane protein YsdA (DUF1294 family)
MARAVARRRWRGARGRWSIPVAAVATGGLAFLLYRLHPSLLAAYLLSLNLVTVAFYGGDKAAARMGLARVPERSLHLLALAGGTPGAFLAQGLFHHKTRKTSFRRTFVLIAILQAGLLVWALWPR